MKFLNLLFGVPLGYVMYFCYDLTGNYGLSILLFTLLTKIFLFPLSLLSQKNAIKMVKMQPQLHDIKMMYEGNNELIIQEQKRLYKEEKYSTVMGILPLLIQIPIILGLINVIYNPLQHILRLDSEQISILANKTSEILSNYNLGSAGQLTVMETVQNAPELFNIDFLNSAVTKIQSVDLMFMGINLSAVPSFGSVTLLIPLFSGLSALLLSVVQNRANVLQREQGVIGKWGMAIFLTLFSGYFAFIVPSGIGVYWIAGNLLSIPVTYICNFIYNPKKYIDYENRSTKAKLTPEERKQEREKKHIARQKEREDSKRFFSQTKQLVFYSESSGFYKYFERLIGYLLENSEITIHYVTSDINDQIFKNDNKQIEKYYIGPTALIPFMMKMDADMVVMTMPDLEKYHVKRSIVKKDVEYVYMDHGMSSFHLTLREGALDNFDTIFCYGQNHVDEVRQTEKEYDLVPKKLVNTGFGLLDTLLENVAGMEKVKNEVPIILIGPSWQKDNLMDYCLDEMLSGILHKGYKVVLRPHPEYVKRFAGKMKALKTKYADDIGEDFVIETDFSSNTTVYTADIVITDWSTIAHEFSYATKNPSLFINTPMKIMNPNYKRIQAVPLDISLRDKIGISLDTDKLDKLNDKIQYLLTHREEFKAQIDEVMKDNIFNLGKSEVAGGEYIISTLAERKKASEKERLEYEALLRGELPPEMILSESENSETEE